MQQKYNKIDIFFGRETLRMFLSLLYLLLMTFLLSGLSNVRMCFAPVTSRDKFKDDNLWVNHIQREIWWLCKKCFRKKYSICSKNLMSMVVKLTTVLITFITHTSKIRLRVNLSKLLFKTRLATNHTNNTLEVSDRYMTYDLC